MSIFFSIQFQLEEEEEEPGGYKCKLFDWYWCIMNLFAQVPIVLKHA